MLFSTIDDVQSYKLVAFYSAFTCIYFPILLSALYFTNYLYSIGKFSFYPVIGVILISEYTKYLLGTFHLLNKQWISATRFDDRYMTASSKRNNNFRNKLKEFMKCCVISIAMLFVYFIIAILFGAEVFSKHEETIMLSAILCVLTIFPPCLNLGSNCVVNLLFGIKPSGDIVWESLLRSLQFTLFGAWLGAFVIPLDWDRPWQSWPIPCALGAMVGYVVGNFIIFLSMLPKFVKKIYSKSGRKVR